MKTPPPRLRMFAGPNGSGKSTLKELIDSELIGIYINPDEIEKEIKKNGFLDLDEFDVQSDENEIVSFFTSSTLLSKAELLEEAEFLRFNDNKLSFYDVSVNAYFASVCADFVRRKLLKKRASFTFETVMSATNKITLLKQAQKLGYRTYLYFIATTDPMINVSRVKHRVAAGGHDVPNDKIVSRYYRSLNNLWSAIQYTNRAYIFDNSSYKHSWLCEITDAANMEIKQTTVPEWFYQSVIAKVGKEFG